MTVLAGLLLTSLLLLAITLRQCRRQRHDDHHADGIERLALVARAGQVGLFELGHDSGACYWSPILRDICGVGPDESISVQRYLDLIPPDEREYIASELQAVYDPAGFGRCQIEHRIVKGTADIRYVRLHAETTFQKVDGVRKPACTVGTVIDITSLKMADASQRDLPQIHAIGTLAGGIAHEFNNRLTAVLGFSELALPLIPADSKAHRHIEQVVIAGRKSRELVHQLLGFSEPGNQARHPLSLHLLLKESLKLWRRTIPAGIVLRERISPTAPPISAQAAHMHAMILRLLECAMQGIRKTGGVLEVGLHDEILPVEHAAAVLGGSYVCLTVRFSANEAAATVASLLADPSSTMDSRREATRLGLSVVHDIVTAHEGTLLLNSGQGCSTTVAVYLPTLAPGLPPSSRPDEPAPRGHECVLFVDDDEALARLGGEMLESLGYYPVVRLNAAEAWIAFQIAPQRFDLLITDRAMPGMTGEMLTRECHRLRPDMPVILSTAPDQAVCPEVAAAYGIAAHVLKPLTLHDLAHTIRRVLDTRVRRSPATGSQFTSTWLIEERDAVSTRR